MSNQIEFLTPAEVAKILKVSVNTVIHRFERAEGVIDLGSEEALQTAAFVTKDSFDCARCWC